MTSNLSVFESYCRFPERPTNTAEIFGVSDKTASIERDGAARQLPVVSLVRMSSHTNHSLLRRGSLTTISKRPPLREPF